MYCTLLTVRSGQWIAVMPVVRRCDSDNRGRRMSGDARDTLPAVSRLCAEANSQLRVQGTMQQLPASKKSE